MWPRRFEKRLLHGDAVVGHHVATVGVIAVERVETVVESNPSGRPNSHRGRSATAAAAAVQDDSDVTHVVVAMTVDRCHSRAYGCCALLNIRDGGVHLRAACSRTARTCSGTVDVHNANVDTSDAGGRLRDDTARRLELLRPLLFVFCVLFVSCASGRTRDAPGCGHVFSFSL